MSYSHQGGLVSYWKCLGVSEEEVRAQDTDLRLVAACGLSTGQDTVGGRSPKTRQRRSYGVWPSPWELPESSKTEQGPRTWDIVCGM